MPEPLSTNDQLVQSAIFHAIMLQRYRAFAGQQIVAFLNTEVFPDVLARVEADLANIASGRTGLSFTARRQLNRLNAATGEILDAAEGRMFKLTSDELSGLAKVDADWQVEVIRRTVPVQLELLTPSPDKLEAILSSQPFEGELLADWFRSLNLSMQSMVKRQVSIGLVGGESVGDIVRRLRGTAGVSYADGGFQITRRNAETIVRTAASHVSAQARQLALLRNRGILKGVQWVSTLDARTSEICRDLDGQIFPVDSGRRPPAHLSCRSTIVPVLKSWRELGFDLDEIPEGTRASLNGQVSSRVSYPEWLKSQPAATQDEALGSRVGRLFRAGSVKIDRFEDPKGRPLTLREYRDRIKP